MTATIPTERLLKAIVTQFCKHNFSYVKSMRIIGSIHVVVDNNEVLSCLLNENEDIKSGETPTAAAIVQQSPAVGNNANTPTPSSGKKIKKQSAKKQQQQKQQLPEPAVESDASSEHASVAATANTSSATGSTTSVNKRKRFVPRAHLEAKTESVAVDTITATENNEKVENKTPEDDESMMYENFQEESMSEEYVMPEEDAELNQEQDNMEPLATAITPVSKSRQVRFSDMTNAAVTTVNESEASSAVKKQKTESLGEQIGEEEYYEGGEENEGERLLMSTGNSSLSFSGRKSVGASGGGGEQQQGEYECVQCDKKFKYYCYYKRHMDARHSEEPKFVCQYCNKSYKWEASFRHHLRSHTNEHVDNNKENAHEQLVEQN